MSSLALSGKVYRGLKVKGEYKALEVLVEYIEDDLLVTTEDVERATKLRLMANGIKTIPESRSHYLYVNCIILDSGAHCIRVYLKKISNSYGVSESVTGWSFAPNQGQYAVLGQSKRLTHFFAALHHALDNFILDYLESNME